MMPRVRLGWARGGANEWRDIGIAFPSTIIDLAVSHRGWLDVRCVDGSAWTLRMFWRLFVAVERRQHAI